MCLVNLGVTFENDSHGVYDSVKIQLFVEISLLEKQS